MNLIGRRSVVDMHNENEPTTDSLERRGRKVNDNGVVEGKDWHAIVAGACGLIAIIAVLVGWLI